MSPNAIKSGFRPRSETAVIPGLTRNLHGLFRLIGCVRHCRTERGDSGSPLRYARNDGGWRCLKFFVLAILLLPFASRAQKADPAIAALLQKVEAAPTDTARVNALVALAEEYRYKAPREGIKRADEAEALATKINYPKGAAAAMLAGAWDEYQAGSLKVAGERFAKATAALEAVGNKPGLSYALGGVAAVQSEGGGDRKAALATVEKARTIAQESGDALAMGRVSFFLGVNNKQAGANDSAIAQLTRAREMLQAAGATREAVKAARALGGTYAAVGRFDEALATMQGAVKAAEALGEFGMLAQAHTAIGDMYYGRKLWSESIRARRLSANAYLQMGDKRGAAIALGNIAGTYSDIYEFGKAVAVLDTARAYFIDVADTAGLAQVEWILGGNALLQDKTGEAVRHLETALRYSEVAGNKRMQAMACRQLGVAFERLGNTVAIRKYAEQSLRLTRESGDRDGYLRSLRSVAGVAVKMGDFGAADSALAEAMELSRASGSPAAIAETHRVYAYRYGEEGDHARAVRSGYEALALYESVHDTAMVLMTYHILMMAYNGAKQYDQTIKLGDVANALAVASRKGEKEVLILQPLSDAYLRMGDYPRMEAVNQERRGILERAGDTTSLLYAQALDAMGEALWSQGRYAEGLPPMHRSLQIREGQEDKTSPSFALLRLGEAYTALAKDTGRTIAADAFIPATREAAVAKSVAYLTRALPLVRTAGARDYIQRTLQALSEAQSLAGDYKNSLANFKEHIALRDSVFNAASTREIARREMEYGFGKQADSIKAASERQQMALQKEQALSALRYEGERKQAAAKSEAERSALRNEEELKRRQIEDEARYTQAALELSRQREAAAATAESEKRAAIAAAELRRQKALGTGAMIGGGLLLVAAVAALFAYRQKRKAAVTIAREKSRSEDLLLNILPAEVADELKTSGGAQAKLHNDVTVLFTDFVNFTGTAEALTPQQLVRELHECFTAFDVIMERHGLEKIKTIGDAYLAVSGLPVKDTRHARKAVQAAEEILEFMEARSRRERTFGIRIGIHSGPVVAGIVGVKKFAYDIWGDTVNTAARMEQAGEAGRINISAATYALVKDEYACHRRGQIAVKGKGEVEMYFVEGRRAAVAEIHP